MFSGKKLILLGFILVLLVAVPVTLYLVQQQQETRSKAAPATILSVVDSETKSSNKSMNSGETATFDVMVNPGTNQVSFVKFTLTYDPTKIEVKDGGFEPDTGSTGTFPSVLQGPTYATGSVSVTLSIGGSLDKVITTPQKAGVLTVTAIGPGTTEIDFGAPQVLSVGATDTFNENVFSSANPAIITIDGGTGGVTTTTTTSSGATTTTTTAAPTTTTTTLGGGTGGTNTLPTCESLALDGLSTGTAPYTLKFTATGNDSDGTISKITFNFGDGKVQDVTEGSGAASISAQISHTYNTAGDYTATAAITDDQGGISDTSSCTQSISIGGGATATLTPTPTIADAGPNDTLITIGAIGAILAVVGVLLLFAL